MPLNAALPRSSHPPGPTLAGAILLLILIFGSCAPRGPVLGSGEKPPERTGTISGVVRAETSKAPLSARKVTAVEVTTGAKVETTTATNGGYTMKVPIGKYRIEVELRAGESVVEGPSDVEIRVSDLDAARDFLIRAQPSAI
jgi:hypothetical protein